MSRCLSTEQESYDGLRAAYRPFDQAGPCDGGRSGGTAGQSAGAGSARSGREWDRERERDRLFFELLKKVFNRRNVTTCFLIGGSISIKAGQSVRFSICAITAMPSRAKIFLPKEPATGRWSGTGPTTVPGSPVYGRRYRP